MPSQTCRLGCGRKTRTHRVPWEPRLPGFVSNQPDWWREQSSRLLHFWRKEDPQIALEQGGLPLLLQAKDLEGDGQILFHLNNLSSSYYALQKLVTSFAAVQEDW